MKLNTKNIELRLQVNTAHQKVEHEVNVNRSLRVEKKNVEQRLTESTAEIQKLKEEKIRLKEEAKQSELEKKELKKKVSELESGSTLNQKIIDTVMKKFFSSEVWINA